MATVAFDGRARPTTAWASDANTGWGNFNSGGGAPASEAQNAYQGGLSVNKKVTSSVSRVGLDFDPGSNSANMSGDDQLRTWFAKCYITDFADLNATFGCALGIGSANNAYYEYNVAGTGANNPAFNNYPAQGGYLIVAINPTVSAWREGTGSGSPTLTAVDYFHFGAQFINGSAKTENIALDAIDIGRGLVITGTPSGDFIDFQTADQGNTSNRWGVVTGNGVAIVARGLLSIGRNTSGTAVATTFSDSSTIVQFADGYQAAGDVGILVDLGSASTAVTIDNTLIGLGTATTVDTRPDFTVSGTSGTCALTGTLDNFRNIVLTSGTTVTGAVIRCIDLTQGSADVEGGTKIITAAATNVAACNDATFGTTTGFNNMEFETFSTSNGHAIEITSTGTYNLTNISFTGYSGTPGSNPTQSTGSSNAAIYNNSGGAVTINILGGDTPSVRNAASSTTTVVNTVNVKITTTDAGGTDIQGTRVLLEAGAGGDLTEGTDIIADTTDVNGEVENSAFNYTTDQPVVGRARKSTLSVPVNQLTNGTFTTDLSSWTTVPDGETIEQASGAARINAAPAVASGGLGNLLDNPTFDTDLSSWTNSSGFTQGSGVATRIFTGSGTNSANLSQTVDLISGTRYAITGDMIVNSLTVGSVARLALGSSAGGTQYGNEGSSIVATRYAGFEYVPGSNLTAHCSCQVTTSSSNIDVDFDNIRIVSTLLTNGTFESDISSWTDSTGFTWSGRGATKTTSTVSNDNLYQTFTASAGVTYRVRGTMEVTAITGIGTAGLSAGISAGNAIHGGITRNSVGVTKADFTITPGAGTVYISCNLNVGTNSMTAEWSQISVEIDASGGPVAPYLYQSFSGTNGTLYKVNGEIVSKSGTSSASGILKLGSTINGSEYGIRSKNTAGSFSEIQYDATTTGTVYVTLATDVLENPDTIDVSFDNIKADLILDETLYKTTDIVGTIRSTGLDLTIQLQDDE